MPSRPGKETRAKIQKSNDLHGYLHYNGDADLSLFQPARFLSRRLGGIQPKALFPFVTPEDLPPRWLVSEFDRPSASAALELGKSSGIWLFPGGGMGDYYRGMSARTELVLGKEGVEALSRARVIVFGLGGVGSWCAEALLRSGIARLKIVDSDSICLSNVNRQIQASSRSLGRPKASTLRERLLEINPEAKIEAFDLAFSAKTAGLFSIEACDYVVDAIDSVADKVFLIETCLRLGKKFLSSMGAGGRSDPSKVRLDRLSRTHECGLARAVRKRLRKNGTRADFLCAFSPEIPVAPRERDSARNGDAQVGGRPVNGSLVQVTATFGFAIAAAIVRDVAGLATIPIARASFHPGPRISP